MPAQNSVPVPLEPGSNNDMAMFGQHINDELLTLAN